ncbi:Zinc finger protein 714 [Plecturocebus cupreus]
MGGTSLRIVGREYQNRGVAGADWEKHLWTMMSSSSNLLNGIVRKTNPNACSIGHLALYGELGSCLCPHRPLATTRVEQRQGLREACGPPGTHFGRPRWVDHLRLEVQDQPGQHGETPSLLKIQNLAGHGGSRLLDYPSPHHMKAQHPTLVIWRA